MERGRESEKEGERVEVGRGGGKGREGGREGWAKGEERVREKKRGDIMEREEGRKEGEEGEV